MTPPGSAGHLYRRPIQYQPESVLLSAQLFPLSCIIIQNEKVLNERFTTKSLGKVQGVGSLIKVSFFIISLFCLASKSSNSSRNAKKKTPFTNVAQDMVLMPHHF